jgi:hypothetical protein
MMMMTATTAGTLPTPNGLEGFTQQVSSRFSNAGTALANVFSRSLFQDSASLKTDIAFWATLIHVVMRIQEAHYTGEIQPNDEQHKNVMSDDEKAYRRNQSAMTYFREAAGMTLGWGVLKVGQAFHKDWQKKHHNYEVSNGSTVSIGKGFGQALDALFKGTEVTALPDVFADVPDTVFKKYNTIDPKTQQLKPIALDPHQHGLEGFSFDAGLVKWGHMMRPFKEDENLSAKFVWNKGFLRRVGEFFNPTKEAKELATLADVTVKAFKTGDSTLLNQISQTQKEQLIALEKEGFKFAQKFVPTIAWSIPGIVFAGVWLERTTLYQGPAVQKRTLGVIDFVQGVWHGALEKVGLAKPLPTPATDDDDDPIVLEKQIAAKKPWVAQKETPTFPYYYADAVGASLIYHQHLYGKPSQFPHVGNTVVTTPTNTKLDTPTVSKPPATTVAEIPTIVNSPEKPVAKQPFKPLQTAVFSTPFNPIRAL